MNIRPEQPVPLAPLKIAPVKTRLSKNETKEMNNYGEVWKVNLNKLGNNGKIFVGNTPSTNEEMNIKRRNNKLVWARKPIGKSNTRRDGGRRNGRRHTIRRKK